MFDDNLRGHSLVVGHQWPDMDRTASILCNLVQPLQPCHIDQHLDALPGVALQLQDEIRSTSDDARPGTVFIEQPQHFLRRCWRLIAADLLSLSLSFVHGTSQIWHSSGCTTYFTPNFAFV